ncbi:carbon-nitrogen hydrolase family protein [Hazenella coriacea]|uniref:Putative amidohydrolase n=1 Tax=Hazenella coriacea TaxID=1179467 RepID=A0A4R3L8N2_9BACL|nr:carbon-nitrogen hydrolase family protein [Hazenella coriacea]TCS95942.1 putative amidohydrolase [Hazenella coriacea]
MQKANVGMVQYRLKPLHSEEDFWNGIESHVRRAQDRGIELLVFPEYLTAHLLALRPAMDDQDVCVYLDDFTPSYIERMEHLSQQYEMIILGGTHIHQEQSSFVNEAFLFFPDGRVERQKKLHLTPEERNVWRLSPGEELNIIDTSLGRIAILICYDIEFPELGRVVAQEDVEIILNPTYTDTWAGYYRVRHCAQARAIENQRYIALCGMVGELPGIPQVDVAHSQSGFFSPCDYPFSPDGVIAMCEKDEEWIVQTELDLKLLRQNWKQGQVSPYKDRKPALYQRLTRDHS